MNKFDPGNGLLKTLGPPFVEILFFVKIYLILPSQSPHFYYPLSIEDQYHLYKYFPGMMPAKFGPSS